MAQGPRGTPEVCHERQPSPRPDPALRRVRPVRRRVGHAAAAVLAAAAAVAALVACFGGRVDPAAIAAETEAATGLRVEATVLHGDARIGGLSGLAYDLESGTLVALSDAADLVLIDPGDPAHAVFRGRLGGLAGERRKEMLDSEAITRRPDGSWVVAFEHRHRLAAYPPGLAGLSARPQPIPTPPDWSRLPANQGIEALAALPDGRLLAFAEGRRGDPGPRDLWVLTGRDWQRRLYQPLEGHSPTDAAVLPNGDLLVLERRFWLPFAFTAHLVLVPAAALDGPDPVRGRLVYRLARPIPQDNYEGLALVPDADGAGGATLVVVSDDNTNGLQQTVVLRLRLPPGWPAEVPGES